MCTVLGLWTNEYGQMGATRNKVIKYFLVPLLSPQDTTYWR